MTDLADMAGGAPLTSAGDVSLAALVVSAADDVVLVDGQPTADNPFPTDGRVAIDTTTDTAYIGDGTQWLDVQSIVALDAITRLARFAEANLPTAESEGRMVWNTDRKTLAFEDGDDWEYPVIGDDVLTSSAQASNTTTETQVFSATLDAGSMKAGRVYEVNLFGKYNTNDSSTTFDLRFKVGETTVATIPSVAANVTDAPVSARLKFTVRAVGGDGEVMVHTESVFNDAHADVHHGTSSIDTTVAEDIEATVEWGSADAGLSVTIGQGYMKEVA